MIADDSLERAIQQIRFARTYTLSLLDGLTENDWFRQPQDGVTHVAWQLGHLAMAQYGLCLFRIRGRQDIDLNLMSSSFRKKFSKGSRPDPDPATNPPIAEIRSVFDNVYAQAMKELPQLTIEQLAEPVEEPWAVSANKLGCLTFCACHEMMHAGQIGLLRRLLGCQPVR